MAIRLYHFINEKYGFEALKKKRLKISRITELNDPFEFMGVSLENPSYRYGFRKMKEEISKRSGVLCMSKNWSNPLLWSHYADKHRGLCIGFDATGEFFKPVEYKENRLSLTDFEFSPTNIESLALMERLAWFKFNHWEYEEEYRAFVTIDEVDPDTGYAFFDFSEKMIPREIILGANNGLDRVWVEEKLNQFGLSLSILKARPAFKTFRVVEQKDKTIW